MRHLTVLFFSSVLLIALAACESEPVEETVWDDQVKALDKAAGVEDELMKRADRLSTELDDSDDEKDK